MFFTSTSTFSTMKPRIIKKLWLRGLRRLQFPYLLFTRSFSGLLLAQNWWDTIDEHLLLGGALMFDDLERLQHQGVRAIVNLSAERPDNRERLRAAQIDYLWLPVMDALPPTVDQIQRGLAWIEKRLNHGHTVYIHCAAGMGRSTTLLACWYIYAHRMSVPQVLHFIKGRRPQVAPTRWQIRRMEEFASLVQQPAVPHAYQRIAGKV